MRRIAACVATFVALAGSPAVAQQASSARLDALIRSATERFDRRGAPREQPPSRPDGQPSPGPAMSLTLDEAIKTALEHNLDIAVQRLNPATYDLAVSRIKSAYLPTVTALVGGQHQLTPPVSLLTGGAQVTADTATFNGALTQNVDWGGGSFTVTWNNNRTSTTSVFYNFNPAYNSLLNAQYTQPLFRGFHTDSARQQLAVMKVNREISDLQVQTVITNTLTSVRNAYWDLVLAVEAIDVATASVNLAHELVDENEKRVQAGAMTRLDLVTATSQEASDRHTLVVAEGTRRTAELTLKRLLAAGADDPIWRASISPVDRPDDRARTIDLEGAIKRALAERTDLAQANQTKLGNDATLAYLTDQTRLQVDLVGAYGLTGLGGTQVIRAINGLDFASAPIVSTVPGSYGSALSSLLGFNYPTWGVAVNVAYPIGFSTAKAEAARAKILAAQVETQTRQLEVQVVTDVTDAAIGVRNSFDEIETAKQARDLDEQKLDAEQKKFGVGMSTNYQVVQAQKDLSSARMALLQAEINYQKSLIDFERSQQTTMQAAGVTLISPASLIAPTVGSGRTAVPAPSGVFIP